MPPRLQLPAQLRGTLSRPAPATASLTSLLAGLSLRPAAATLSAGSVRSAHILASLAPNAGSTKDRKRVGRGASSGYGKTSGRGQKGRKARGQVNPRFQGGQTPLIKIKGKRGFDNLNAPKLSTTNLEQIKEWIDNGRLDPTKPITPKELIESGIIGSVRDGIKVLARGSTTFDHPVTITVSRASASAIAAIEAAGGKITTRYYTRLAIRRLLEGKSLHSDKPLPFGAEHVEGVLEEARKTGFKYRLPDPTSRWDVEYYRDPAHRGYMSHLLPEGKNPSLFFGVPTEKRARKKVTKQAKAVEEEKIF
ncbi:related to MVP1 protein [Cephalotrichum gorgonifer]|uniref:Related to MVP1 protein n=1 Tax=Cephalotrichum gorgonifer TaxID=2041049 RepID=A0AAE8N0G3_9PEZI|nr:related to MVP1 protein [Cephalotrichum gorgonifer]